MKVYLSVPLRNNRNQSLAKQIYAILNECGYEIISDWILLDNPNPNLDTKGIYERDYNAIKSCNLFIAEVSQPSIGIGMEIMLAKVFEKKIVCIHRRDKKISNFLIGLPGVLILSYDNLDELKDNLKLLVTN